MSLTNARQIVIVTIWNTPIFVEFVELNANLFVEMQMRLSYNKFSPLYRLHRSELHVATYSIHSSS